MADKPEMGKMFAGWKVNGEIISADEAYTFFAGTELTVEAVYGNEPVTVEAQAHLQDITAAKRNDDRYNLRYLAQLVIPEGCKLVNAGLVWSNKGLDTEDALQIKADGTTAVGVKVTKISAISSTYQFSVTIKGVPVNTEVPGRIFAEIEDADGNRYVYSEILTGVAK